MGLKVCEVEHERARVGVGALKGGDRERLGVRAGALGDGEEVVEAVAGLEELGVEVQAEGLGVGELWLGGGWHVFDSRIVWVVCAGQSAALGRVVGRTTRPERADAERPGVSRDPPLEGAGSWAELGQGSPQEGIARRSLALALYAENEPVTWV